MLRQGRLAGEDSGRICTSRLQRYSGRGGRPQEGSARQGIEDAQAGEAGRAGRRKDLNIKASEIPGKRRLAGEA